MLPKSAFEEVHGFEARKLALVQDPKDACYKLTIKIQPGDMPRWLMDCAAGQILAIGVKALDVDNPDAAPTPSIVQRAALLCKNPHFQKFLAQSYNVTYEDALNRPADYYAAEFICFHCEIASRAELRHNDKAREKFEELIKEFNDSARSLRFE